METEYSVSFIRKGTKITLRITEILLFQHFCLVCLLVLLHLRLSSFVDANDVIPEEQIGFQDIIKTLIDKYIGYFKTGKLYVCYESLMLSSALILGLYMVMAKDRTQWSWLRPGQLWEVAWETFDDKDCTKISG